MPAQNSHFYKALMLLSIFSIGQFTPISAQATSLQAPTRSLFERLSNNWQELPTSYKWGVALLGSVGAALVTWKIVNSIRDYRDPEGAKLSSLKEMQEKMKSAIDSNSTELFDDAIRNADCQTYIAYLNDTKYDHEGKKRRPILYSFIIAEKNKTEPIIGKHLINTALNLYRHERAQQEALASFSHQAVKGRCMTYLSYVLYHELYSPNSLVFLTNIAENYPDALRIIETYSESLSGTESKKPIAKKPKSNKKRARRPTGPTKSSSTAEVADLSDEALAK